MHTILVYTQSRPSRFKDLLGGSGRLEISLESCPKMAHKNLTQLAVERLKPTSKSTVYWDTNLPGFGLRISPRGKKVWICMYSVSGRSVMETERLSGTKTSASVKS